MAYASYADESYYSDTFDGSILPDEDMARYLRQASRHIDSLTYNRIIGQGFTNLTQFQQDVIREVVCQQAEFEYENADLIETVISGYSLNGASVQFGSAWNVRTQNGVAMRRDTYRLLEQTGLCCRLAR